MQLISPENQETKGIWLLRQSRKFILLFDQSHIEGIKMTRGKVP